MAVRIRRAIDGSLVDDLRSLRAGDECLISGPVFCLRDATCKKLQALIAADEALPVKLAGQVLFFAGPTPPRAGRVAGSIGPTTAARMDAATVALMDAGAIATIGKGARSPAIAEVCRRTGGVYFGAVGGIAALLARHVTAEEIVAYPELGTEALRRLTLVAFPVFVAVDSHGSDWYSEAPRRFLEELR
jgi:tartrate/fumarate subfamily iron-sulfur-dependent hydro-lyase beta chain